MHSNTILDHLISWSCLNNNNLIIKNCDHTRMITVTKGCLHNFYFLILLHLFIFQILASENS
jgi:hypothetical protein